MVNTRASFRIFAALTFPLTISAAANAQPTRTCGSGVGDDGNPSSRAARMSASDPVISNNTVTAVGVMSNEFGRQ